MASIRRPAFLTRLWNRFGMAGLVYSSLALLVGAAIGLGIFTFVFANGIAYFGSSPETCAQCHAMDEHYEGWQKGSHADVATCNDCHAPHDNIVHKYWNKADNGFWHALKFTTGDYPENIEIREKNSRITQDSCLSCHGDLVHAINMTRSDDEQVGCIQCHSEVGHMR